MSDEAAEPTDLRRVARDAGPFASAIVAVVIAAGGAFTGSGVAREVQALREAVIRLEGKVAQGEGAENRIRALELKVAALEAHAPGGPK